MGFPLPDTGSVTEDSGVVGGFLTTNGDVDYGPFFNGDAGQWTAETIAGAYGSQLVIDSDGVWTYQADNSDPTIQALNAGDSITEVFTVTSVRGTTTVTITINGADEPPCFVAGTLIDTPHGPRPVESLKAGDVVLTRDNGEQAIQWIGQAGIDLAGQPEPEKLAPIRVARDAIAPGVPDRDLLLSPMHRILVSAPEVQLLFGQDEVLCAVKHLVNGRTIRQDLQDQVTYFHLMFDDHQVLSSSGCLSESFYPGRIGLDGFVDETRQELFALFPQLRSMPESYGRTARPVLRGYEGRMIRDSFVAPAPFLFAREQDEVREQVA